MARIVIEEPCEHGDVQEHPRPGAMPAYSLGSAGVGYSKFDMCPGGSRRVLDPGPFIDEVAHAVMCYSWTTDALADMESPMEGLDLARMILDALVGVSDG